MAYFQKVKTSEFIIPLFGEIFAGRQFGAIGANLIFFNYAKFSSCPKLKFLKIKVS